LASKENYQLLVIKLSFGLIPEVKGEKWREARVDLIKNPGHPLYFLSL